MHVDGGAASNNHFDEDGLIGIFALTRPELGRSMARCVEIARAGDFGICRSRNAARIAFVLAAYAEQSSSPLPRSTFAGPVPGGDCQTVRGAAAGRAAPDHPCRGFPEALGSEDRAL